MLTTLGGRCWVGERRASGRCKSQALLRLWIWAVASQLSSMLLKLMAKTSSNPNHIFSCLTSTLRAVGVVNLLCGLFGFIVHVGPLLRAWVNKWTPGPAGGPAAVLPHPGLNVRWLLGWAPVQWRLAGQWREPKLRLLHQLLFTRESRRW